MQPNADMTEHVKWVRMVVPSIGFVTVAHLLGCSSVERIHPERQSAGSLVLPLATVADGVTYRLIGTIRVRAEDGSLAATVQTNADSPDTTIISLSPGTYSLEVGDEYSCDVSPPDATYTACTYVDANPNPFTVATGESTSVLLKFIFHFDGDVDVVLGSGHVVFTLDVVIDRQCECDAGQECVSVEGGAPTCRRSCARDEDCDPGRACLPLTNSTTGVCEPLGGDVTWSDQFGAEGYDHALAVDTDSNGQLLIVGSVEGALPEQAYEGGSDGFVRKYDAAGNVSWTRQFGGRAYDRVDTVGTDSNDDIFVAGQLRQTSSEETLNAFLRKYDADGNELWTRQFGTAFSDTIAELRVDDNDDVLVVGTIGGPLPGETQSGYYDGFLRKYDNEGSERWTQQFGTSGSTEVNSVDVGSNGVVVIAGTTEGVLPGESGSGRDDAFVRAYSSEGSLMWTRQFGSSDVDYGYRVRVDSEDNVLVLGETLDSLPGQTSTRDAFLRKYDASGNELWTRQFGSNTPDMFTGLAINDADNVLVVGPTTGAFPGTFGSQGFGYARLFTSSGDDVWIKHLSPSIRATCFDGEAIYVVGDTVQEQPGPQPGYSYSDVFVARLAP